MNWQPSTGASSYKVFANGKQVATISTSTVVTGLLPQTQYTFTVKGVSGRPYVGSERTDHHVHREIGWPGQVRGRGIDEHADRECGHLRLHPVLGWREIGNIGYDASATLNDITVPATGTYLVKIAYTDGDTSRQSMLTVNDADSYWVNYHGLGDNDWVTPQVTYLPMKLTAGANSIKVSNPSGYIADIDWITV